MCFDCVIYSREVCVKGEGLVNFGIVGFMFMVLRGETPDKRGAITVFYLVYSFMVVSFYCVIFIHVMCV